MHPRLVLSLGNFFSVAHFFLVIYIIAPYLATFMPAAQTGLVVSLGAVVTLAAFPFMPRLVARYGARHLALYLGFLQALVLLLLGAAPVPMLAIACVAIACAVSPLLAYQLDLLLEATMAEEENATGRIRTAFLTAGNIALILAPLAIGFILDGTEAYERVFLFAALTLTPFITLFFAERLPEIVPPSVSGIRDTCLCVFADRDLQAIAIGNAILQFFYHLAPLYIPLYLHSVLGLPWSDLGWMFAVMLLPFPLLEYPAGYLADKWLGDKELMVAGFAVMGLSFASLAFVTAATPLLLILLVLVLTRVGSALVEAMVEGHFFRRVSGRDANTVSVFRMMRPLAALTAPLVASLLLAEGDYLAFFLSTGIVIGLVGMINAFRIRDFR